VLYIDLPENPLKKGYCPVTKGPVHLLLLTMSNIHPFRWSCCFLSLTRVNKHDLMWVKVRGRAGGSVDGFSSGERPQGSPADLIHCVADFPAVVFAIQ